MKNNQHPWPVLSFDKLKATLATVHLWTQIVGKIRLQQMPWINHSWHVTLYVYSRGLTTGAMPYPGGVFQIEMDFVDHELIISTSDGRTARIPLLDGSVADFYQALFGSLHQLGIAVSIYGRPNEMAVATPFKDDHSHRNYDKVQMNLFFEALARIEVVFTSFRACFTGKVSPVHLFWGSFDLAVTRFSGRPAPKYQGGVLNIPLDVMQEAYSHEVSSAGFWPGSEEFPVPAFYSYCYPMPEAFSKQPVGPAQAFFSEEKGEFFLPYEAVQQAEDPEGELMRFLQTTYRAAAVTGKWDKQLECDLTYLKRQTEVPKEA
jgi:Family of unknown function (DUF5996)